MSSTPKCLQVSGATLKRTPHHGLVAVIRTSPQHYEVRKDGALMGTVTKFQHWYARPRPPADTMEHKSSTMKDCVDWLSWWDHNYGAKYKCKCWTCGDTGRMPGEAGVDLPCVACGPR